MRGGAFDAIDRVVGHGVFLAEVLKERGERRELSPDRGPRKHAALQILSPSDQVRPGDGAKIRGLVDADEAHEVPNVSLVSAAGEGVVEIGEPLELGWDLGKALELGGGGRGASG
jgi:hypothetical protein